MEEAAHLGSEPQKSTFEVRGPAAALHAISHPHIVVVAPSLLYAYCFSVPCGPLYSVMEPPDNMYVRYRQNPFWATLGPLLVRLEFYESMRPL